MLPTTYLALSGERFSVTYRLTGDEAQARDKARDICIEQTVEFPENLLPDGDIREHIVGRIESLERVSAQSYEAVISYAVETTGFDFVQLLNVMFGNSSIKPGIRVERLELPESLLRTFKGPRFGQAGLRALVGVADRPLLCTALKPMGLPPSELAKMAYQVALGGIDLIKDDHGMADQAFAPFAERVSRCAEAVQRANQETGHNCLYLPNVPGPIDRVVQRGLLAKEAGAGGLLVSPGLLGLDAMRLLAANDAIGLPIMAHPAFQGCFVTSPDTGVSHYVLFGQISRLAGGDVTIFPNFGGRFSFSKEDCTLLAQGCVTPMGHIRPIFPAPAGGMTLERVPEMLEVYGRDVIFLIGGGLHQRGPDLTANSRYFRQLVETLTG